jgi:uncharacterized protein (DUF58 family)
MTLLVLCAFFCVFWLAVLLLALLHHALGSRVPPFGRVWLVLAGGMVLIGWYMELPLLLLLGYFLLAIWGVNLFLAGRGLQHVHGWRRVQGPVFAGTAFQVEMRVEYGGYGKLIGVRLEDWGPQHMLQAPVDGDRTGEEQMVAIRRRDKAQQDVREWFALQLRSGVPVDVRGRVILPRRCIYYWAPAMACRAFPFGLTQSRVSVYEGEYVVVYPRLGQLHLGRLRHRLRGFSQASQATRPSLRARPQADTDYYGLRPFRTGDSPRAIHWRTSARRGELMVREFEDTVNNNLVVVLEPWQPHFLRTVPGVGVQEDGQATAEAQQSVEEAISLTATICWEWCKQPGGRLVLAVAGFGPVVVDGRTGRESAFRILECLTVTQASGLINAAKLVERLKGLRLAPAPVLLVTTRPTELTRSLQAALQRPVLTLDVNDLNDNDFYERPGAHEG